MKYQIDHDYHIHSSLSSCSHDEGQTKERIFQYAVDNGLKELCITDHFWDETIPGASGWYKPQNCEHICSIQPLPQSDEVKFYFGCETDMDKFLTVGISRERLELFDMIIVPTTHLHMRGFTIEEADDSVERRAYRYVERLDALLQKDLPFSKIGLAHPTCPLLAGHRSVEGWWEKHLQVLDTVTDKEYRELFGQMAAKGVGFELNFTPASYSAGDLPRVLRPHRIAKEVGCKFYLGADAHTGGDLQEAMERFRAMVDLMELTEEDKWRFR